MTKQRVAVVTGATGGIGQAICQALAPAWQVIGTCHTAGDETMAHWRTQMEPTAELVRLELTDHEQTTQAVEAILARHGAPALLVNCAGITADGFFSKMSFADWENVIRTNLVSLFSITQPIYLAMCTQGGGVIINISSVNGERGQAGQTNYCASKAGIHGFTMSLAKEGARFGVRVNTVSPGYTMTPMVVAMRDDVQARIVESIPLGRFAEAAEVAGLVKYLASSESAYITGANLHINGGLHIG